MWRVFASASGSARHTGAGTVRRWRTPAAAVTFANAPVRVDSGVREVRGCVGQGAAARV
mgnify:CR=1 FL=1